MFPITGKGFGPGGYRYFRPLMVFTMTAAINFLRIQKYVPVARTAIAAETKKITNFDMIRTSSRVESNFGD
jgi:hypothetical protein